MDFKVAGTKDGITAIQMDIKIGRNYKRNNGNCFKTSIGRRMFIIDKMEAVISEPRAEVSENAPKIEVIKINPDKIAGLIGMEEKLLERLLMKLEFQ